MSQEKNEKGQFKITTGYNDKRYKVVQYLGKRINEHRRNFCIVLGIKDIPKGFVIHHLDKNKKNNDINNLCLLTITAHNRIHSHSAWNKGITTKESEKWNEAIKKAVHSRKMSYVANKGKEVFELRETGLSFIDIAKRLMISRETASHRYHTYIKYNKIINP